VPRSHRIRALFIAALAVVGLGVSSLPAHAATLTITSLSCEPTVSAIRCETTVSGGTAPYAYSWKPSGNYPTSSWNLYYCAPGTTFIVTVGVVDSRRASASKTINAYCAGGTQ
jgi:hypothetical protein